MSYGDDAGFSAWLSQYGYSLPSGAPSAAVLRARGSNYIDAAYEALWTGQRTDGVTQENGWPRTGAKLNCTVAIASDAIPATVVQASYRAAYLDAVTPGALSASFSSGQRVKRQKVDVIEREFYDDGGATAGSGQGGFVDAEIDGMMRPFICNRAEKFMFQSVGSDNGD